MEVERGIYIRDYDIQEISETIKLYQKIEGDVSCIVWDAAIVLSKFLEKRNFERTGFLRGKKVVELGAGLGCAGLIAACLGAQVISTDLPECMPLLNSNISKNEHVWSKYGHIKSSPLKWGENNNLDIIPDKILLSDCVYYEESIQPLIQTLVELSGPETEIYLCQEIRDSKNQEKYWKIFMAKLEEHFKIRILSPNELDEQFFSLDINTYKITKLR